MDMKSFLDACRKTVGTSNLTTEVDTSVVSGSSRRVPAIIFPSSTKDVQEIVLAANRFLVPIYPVSTGHNWGMGSFLPSTDGCVVVNLSRMNKIRDLSVPFHNAVIEAGVTQGQLADHLVASQAPLILDSTGSARHTSVIGCALDRGVAYNSQRAESIFNLEVVLGNGEIVKSGFGHFANAVATQAYRNGIGPSLDGLFIQSNLGIVTSATIELMPKPLHHVVFVAKITSQSDLPILIKRLHLLKQRGVISSVPHIANRSRTSISLAPLVNGYMKGRGRLLSRVSIESIVRDELPTEWSMVGSLSGSMLHVVEGMAGLVGAMKKIGKVTFVTAPMLNAVRKVLQYFDFLPPVEKKLAFLYASQEVFGMTMGIPSNSALHSVYWPVGDEPKDYTNPDKSEAGLLYCLPIIPVDEGQIRKALAIMEACFCEYGFTLYITVNLLENALESVINLAFDRKSAEKTRLAHECISDLHERLAEAGLYPYRVGIDFMGHVLRNDSFWETVREIKKSVDPNGIISPGRYCLP